MQRKTAFKILAAGSFSLILPFIVRFPSVEAFLALGLILVSVGIYGLLKGYESPKLGSSISSKPARKFQVDWKVVIGVLFVFGMIAKAVNPNVDDQTPAKQQYAKKNGTYDERKDDLDELCKDWVYYKAKSYKYGREGDARRAAEARASLADVNLWLSAYNEADVTKVCNQYDTPEKLEQYMR